MAQRIPLQSVMVKRDGKLIRPAIGKPFDFTAEELKDIKALSPRAVRTLQDESDLVGSQESKLGEVVTEPTATLGTSNPTANNTSAKPQAGKVSGGKNSDL